MLHITLMTWIGDAAFALCLIAVIFLTWALASNAAILRQGRRDTALWTLYTLLLSAICVPVTNVASEVVGVIIIFSVLIGLVLNHPCLQLMGWIGAIIATFIALISLPTAPLFVFIQIPIGIVLSCGLATVGYKLTKYRPFFVVYCKRFWRALQGQLYVWTRPLPESTENESRNELTEGLLNIERRRVS